VPNLNKATTHDERWSPILFPIREGDILAPTTRSHFSYR